MRALFLDTSGWYASMTPQEPKHAVAQARLEESARAGVRIVTTSHVVAEMHAMLLKRQGVGTARYFIDRAFGADVHQVVYPDEELIAAARTRWLRRFSDQRFSLCDAVSFEVMRRERITSALATDRHFAIAGFEILT